MLSSGTPWQLKVEELAGRAISLEALLTFYADLPATMSHFRSGVHRTLDVVRQAIIPLTRQDACSFATMINNGVVVRPRKMVSHNWGNLFRDLVAAVIADALDECEFGSIAYLMDNHFDNLMCYLREKDRLHITYWICCFAVDQHSAICGENQHAETDPIQHELHPVCTCQKTKALNSSEPLDVKGRSIPCELNKFHDMIKTLASSDESFEQVIAVDADFEVFNRAWVVAEISAGHAMGLHQRMKLRNAQVLKKAEKSLRKLDVRKMSASRPEDIQEVLQGIPDKAEFNQHLQDMIFGKNGKGGLLKAWRGLDSLQRMDRIGHIAKLSQISRLGRSATQVSLHDELPSPV